MNPSRWFQTGGALVDPQRLGCTEFIVRWGLALAGLILLIVLYAFT